MPVLMVSRVEYDGIYGYHINLDELCQVLPHLREGNEMSAYIIEVRDNYGKLVKRFKPFKKIQLEIRSRYVEHSKRWVKYLYLPEDLVTKFNIGKDYRIMFILLSYNNKPILPFEIKEVGYEARREAQRILEYFSKIEVELLTLNLENPILNKVASYLWDAYYRLEENDIEGARTSVRNSLNILRDELVPKIEVVEEAKDYPQNLKKLINGLREFVHYGGPHPGPAPKTTTEMIVSMTIELVKYLGKALESNIITLKESN